MTKDCIFLLFALAVKEGNNKKNKNMAPTTSKILPGLHSIADNYDGFLIDVYGVIHNGSQLYAGVIDCLKNLLELNKTVGLISNTPCRSRDLSSRLKTMGIPSGYFQYVFTAGEDVFQHILKRDDPWYSKLGDNCYFIGPAQSRFIDELPVRKVERMEEADFILVTGADDWHQRLSDYKNILAAALKKGIPMICANPNISEVPINSPLEAGTIEQYYEEQGGEVRIHGKPNKQFFQKSAEKMERKPILSIGDSLYYDMKGADLAGLDTAFIACCAHKSLLCDTDTNMPEAPKLESYYKQFGYTPKYTFPHLAW